MSSDTVFLLQAFIVGAAIVFTYDWLRILRRVIPHRQFVVSLEDFFFWLVCAVVVFIWMYRVSNGGMRWFAVAGALFGMYLYRKLFSVLFVGGMSRVLKFVLHIIGKIISVLLRPLRCVGRRVGGLHGRLRQRKKKIAGNIKIWLKSYGKALKMRLSKR